MKRHAAAAVCACVIGIAGAAWAQGSPHPTVPTEGPSSIPPGDGTIRGVVTDADHPGATGGLTVALYALQPDGTPGIGSTETAPDGSFAFAGVLNDAAIVYLVGVRYHLVPHGERTAFAAGQREIEIEIAVKRPTTDTSSITTIETTLQIESHGTRLVVLETHKLESAGAQPVYVAKGERADRTPPFRANLPRGALNFQAGAFNSTEGFEHNGSELSYWGPLYNGEQELRYSYELPVEPNASVVAFEKRFPRGTGRIRVLAPERGPRVESPDLVAGNSVEIEGTQFVLLQSRARDPGAAIRLTVHVPETTSDLSALRLGRAEFSIELDDTFLEVTQTQKLSVAPGAHLGSTRAEPLLRFEVPLEADLVGVSAGAEQLGIRAIDSPSASPPEKGISLLGPIGPGEHEFTFRYRIPAENGAASLDLRFPMTVPTLLIRTADTGLLIESERLHRLRPQVIGTRTWMMREAFHVEADERLSIRFEALDQKGPWQFGGLAFLAGASAFVLFFVVSPLRKTRSEIRFTEDDRSGPAHERDLVYAMIRDLEHDFETGKVAEEDYQRSRTELRARAIELMREEKQNGPQLSSIEPLPASIPSDRICASCGAPTEPGRRLCTDCDRANSEPGR